MTVTHLDETFPYDLLTPTTPRALQGGGAFYSDIHVSGSTLRIQLPECVTKGGVVITKRGGYVDLVYSVSKHAGLIDAIEKLEKTVTNLVAGKRELWFTNEVSEHDLEEMTVPITRSYKSGRFFTMRINVPRSKLAGTTSFLFDEKRVAINAAESELGERHVIPLVSLEGLKYTSRSVSVELSAVQLMVLDNDEERGCMIEAPLGRALLNASPDGMTAKAADDTKDTTPECSVEVADAAEPPPAVEDAALREVAPVVSSEDPIQLRKQSDVYNELYTEAYAKARKLQGAAVEAYARAKEIREIYGISDCASDSDFDSEEDEERDI
jgi:hypothetical protein